MIFSQPWSYQDLWIHSVCRTRFGYQEENNKILGIYRIHLSIDEGEITKRGGFTGNACHGAAWHAALREAKKRQRAKLGRQNRSKSVVRMTVQSVCMSAMDFVNHVAWKMDLMNFKEDAYIMTWPIIPTT